MSAQKHAASAVQTRTLAGVGQGSTRLAAELEHVLGSRCPITPQVDAPPDQISATETQVRFEQRGSAAGEVDHQKDSADDAAQRDEQLEIPPEGGTWSDYDHGYLPALTTTWLAGGPSSWPALSNWYSGRVHGSPVTERA